VLERGRERIGRIYVDRRADEICLVDIALLPQHRGGGIGTALIEDLLREAREAGKPLRCHVEQNNRAIGLYRRLGFRPIAQTGVYHQLEWTPPPSDG
jgi:ribosomal protein S18 acetylase RimI-like enzyme